LAVFLRFRCAGIGIPPTVRIIVHRACYDGTIPERQVRFMFYYSKRSHRRIVHTHACFLVRGFDSEAIGTFETLSEALMPATGSADAAIPSSVSIEKSRWLSSTIAGKTVCPFI